ncbi:ankyrin repeat-containing domain protein [Penicillium waksmanii]|uniref:ankyrin repeat-containing domain protein n=1 Tax=Penicillium waksmanii TaxID=69791 RepID=UPI00254761B3|nr:ankyrin repeat-containing domain protein [Penicillium waksmanii]KAJ5988518.1 ankyrin repeat-containing domain protein [Penicillium waksmanii]
MMDGISAAAAILQVAQMAGQAAMTAHDLFSTIKNAPNEINAIKNDILSFQILVSSLERSLSSSDVFDMVNEDSEISHAILTLLSPIENCKIALDRILQKMKPYLKTETSSPDPKTGSTYSPRTGETRMNGVLWYFRRREVFALSLELERTKSTFGNAMGHVTLIISTKSALGFGDRTFQGKIEFNPDVGTSLFEYASTVKAAEHPDDEATPFPRHLADHEETSRPNLPSGPEAAKDIKAAMMQGGGLLLKAILAHAHVDARDKKGRTALSHAAEKGQLESVKILLKHGASVSARQWSVTGWAGGKSPYRHSGATALWQATEYGHLEIVKLLLEHGANPEGWAPIHGAVCRDSVEVLQLLIDHGALIELPTTQPEGKTPLHYSVAHKTMQCMKMLLQHGADPNSLMLESVTPLHLAAAGGWIPGIKLLMEQDVFIDARDALLFETALHKAARNCEHSAIAKLRELGANQEAKNVDGLTYQEILEFATEAPKEWRVASHLGVYISQGVWQLTHDA